MIIYQWIIKGSDGTEREWDGIFNTTKKVFEWLEKIKEKKKGKEEKKKESFKRRRYIRRM